MKCLGCDEIITDDYEWTCCDKCGESVKVTQLFHTYLTESQELFSRLAEINTLYWRALMECDLGCCFEPKLERLSEDAKKLMEKYGRSRT